MRGLALIGPPGAGKTTLLPRLGRALYAGTLDTDAWIAMEHRKTISELYSQRGENFLLREEERCLRRYDLSLFVVATSGSVVLSRAREILRRQSLVVWIDVPAEETLRFLAEPGGRAILGRGSLREIIEGRRELYQNWADRRVSREGKSRRELAEEIADLWRAQREEPRSRMIIRN